MPDNDAPINPGLALFKLRTQNRPFSLLLARPDGNTEDELLPQKVIGHEAVCGTLEYRMLCVADSATLPLRSFIGVPAELRIVTDRGNLRRVCGIITEASSGQSDGALATYQIVFNDALTILERRTNTRIFRNMNELDIIRILVGEWRERNAVLRGTFDLAIDGALAARQIARREFIMQHNESDAAFIRRLLQRQGIAWFIQPGLPERPGQNPQAASAVIGHTLVLFDESSRLSENAAGTVRFHRDAATEERDSITGWSAVRSLQPGSVSLHSWDYKNPSSTDFMGTNAPSRADQGERGNVLASILDDYQVAAPHISDNALDLTDLGNVRVGHYQYETKCFHGEGGVRDLAAGEWFALDDHPEIDLHSAPEREFVITSQHIAAQNNLPIDISARVHRLFNRSGWNEGEYRVFENSDGESIRYRTRFTCVRRGIRIVPPFAVLPRPQLQTAIVVGPPNEEIWCDELGRVRVRFPATRPEDHVHSAGVGSSDADGDSAWIRVASSWAGNGPGSSSQIGARLLPAVGTEVLVDFAGGDPDKPVIIGQLYNGIGTPPAFRREGNLPETKYQSGLRSREVRGQRGNQLRLDDTPGQISAQLASDHAHSELNVGFLTELRQDGRAAPRGEGAELRTEESIALHAARGILLSAWKLLGGTGSKGGQLARDDYLNLLRECSELCTSLGNYSAEHNGLAVDPKEQNELLARFRNWEDGSNTAPKAPERGESVIGLTSPSGIGFASSKAIVSYSATNIDTVAQKNLQQTSGQQYSVNAGKGISLFAHHGGLNAIAHFGKVLIQSQHDDTDINSAKNLTMTATDGTVTLSSKVILLIAGDGSFLRLGAGAPVLGSREPLKFHAPDFLFDGPETMQGNFPSFGAGETGVEFAGHYYPHINGGIPAGNLMHRLASSDGHLSEALADENGHSQKLTGDSIHFANIEFLSPKDE